MIWPRSALFRFSRRCRVTPDTNHYSVPPRYAGVNLVLKAYPDRLCLYVR